jgi:arylsulfatase A-like enzyme
MFVAFALLLLYPVLGGLMGAIVGAALGSTGPTRHRLERVGVLKTQRAVAMLTLIGISFALVLSQPAIGASGVALLVVHIALLCVWVLSLRRMPLPGWLNGLANPWTSSALLTGLTWIAFGYNQSRLLRAVASLVFVVVVAVVTRAISARLRRGDRELPVPRVVTVAAAVVLVFATSFAVNRAGRPPFPPPSGSISASADKPNVVIITLDTVRADHLSLYGYARDTTPKLVEFAREATRYANALSPGNFTLPAHASMFTGLYPSEHGAHNSRDDIAGLPLGEDFTTLAELMVEQGYRTFAVSANTAYVTGRFGLDQGFEYFDSQQDTTAPWAPCLARYFLRCSLRDLLKVSVARKAPDSLLRSAEQINQEAFAILDGVAGDGDRPFLLFLNYMDGHFPYLPPAPFDTLFPGKDPGFSWASADTYALEAGVNSLSRTLQPEEHEHLVSQYDGSIAYLDAKLGELFDRLRRDGLLDDTLVVIWSDHGESFMEHGFLGHGVSLYQSEIGVPMVVRYPGQSAGRVVEAPVSSVDLLPTIMEVADIDIEHRISGESLLDIGGFEARPVFSESFPAGNKVALHERFDRTARAIVSGQHKLIWSSEGMRELYDLSVDPGEAAGVMTSNTAADTLEATLASWLQGLEIARPSDAVMDEATLRRLRALGYIR